MPKQITDPRSSLSNLKYGIWLVAVVWLASDLYIVFTNSSASTPIVWLLVLAVSVPVAWWLIKLVSRSLSKRVLFKWVFLRALLRKLILFGSAVVVAFYVILKVAGYTIAEAPNEPFPPAFGFTLFAAIFYFALRGRVDESLQ